MTPDLSGAIDHVHVYVTSRVAAADWYRDKLGFKVMEEFAFWATPEGGPLTIANASNTIHFALFRSVKPKPVSLAFGASRQEYVAWKAHLATVDISLRQSDHGLCHSMYFNDPFGNELEITTYEVG
ncbi:MAG: VOC family protein [Gammaproteobacteria bacterium]